MYQCRISKDGREQILWLPVDKNDEGRYVDLKGAEGRVDRNWLIKKIYPTIMTKEQIEANDKARKHMNKVTGR